MIEKVGPITPTGLSEKLGVPVPAVSQWMRGWMGKGIIGWCDENGNEFGENADLEKAKRVGRTFLKAAGECRLPTPNELTEDMKWSLEGELLEFYDLGIETGGQMGGPTEGVCRSILRFFRN